MEEHDPSNTNAFKLMMNSSKKRKKEEECGEEEEEEEEEEGEGEGEDLNDYESFKKDFRELHQPDEEMTEEDRQFIADENEEIESQSAQQNQQLDAERRKRAEEEEKKKEDELLKFYAEANVDDDYDSDAYGEEQEQDIPSDLMTPMKRNYNGAGRSSTTTSSSSSSYPYDSTSRNQRNHQNQNQNDTNPFDEHSDDIEDLNRSELNELERRRLQLYEKYALIFNDPKFLDEEYKNNQDSVDIPFADRESLLKDFEHLKNEPGQLHDPTNTMFKKLLEHCYILDKSNELSTSRLFQVLKHLERKWTPLPHQRPAEFARARYCLDPSLNAAGTDITSIINEQHKLFKTESIALLRLFARRNWDVKDPNQKLANRILSKINHDIYTSHLLISCELSLIRSNRRQLVGSAPPFNPLMLRQENVINYQGFNLFIDTLLRSLELLGYQKKGKYIRKEKLTPDGKKTGYFEQTQSIEEWVLTETSNSSSNAAYKDAKQYIKKAAEYLEVCFDKSFPHYTPHRRVFSFRNGRYFADAEGLIDTFLSYEENEKYKDVTSVNYFDVDFNSFEELGFDYEVLPDGNIQFEDGKVITPEDVARMGGLPAPWIDAPKTPTYDKILVDTQKWSRQKYKLFWAHYGRILYAAGQMDNWEKFMFLVGAAGTGKSTIGRNMVEVFENADLGVLSNKNEQIFGYANIFGKLLTVCMEVKADFDIGEAQFQSMCSAEYLQISVKNKTAIMKKWDSTILLLGNETPTWSNTSGAIKRRCSPFIFKHNIAKIDVDTTMSKQFPHERPAVLRKAIWGYLSTQAVLKNRPVDILYTPDQVAWLESLTDATNTISSFLQQKIVCSQLDNTMKEATFIPSSLFKKHYHSYLKVNYIQRKKELTEANYLHIFAAHNIQVTGVIPAHSKMYNGEKWPYQEKWFIGTDLNLKMGKSVQKIEGVDPNLTEQDLQHIVLDVKKKQAFEKQKQPSSNVVPESSSSSSSSRFYSAPEQNY